VDRYRVFVADPKSWKLWYDGSPGDWVAGQAVPTGHARIETEVLATELTPTYADKLLRHELAHVSTLRNDNYYGRDDVWWLVEGMADHVALAVSAWPRSGWLDPRHRLPFNDHPSCAGA
jgi:hypothetical protein